MISMNILEIEQISVNNRHSHFVPLFSFTCQKGFSLFEVACFMHMYFVLQQKLNSQGICEISFSVVSFIHLYFVLQQK